MKQIVEFTAAYDRRDPDPKKNYGIHGVDIRFLLKGEEGAVQFLLFTGWLLPETVGVEEATLHRYGKALSIKNAKLGYPMPADLGYHSPKPMYEDHIPMANCDVLGSQCYYDGSSLNADPVFLKLLREGHKGVWSELEEYYNHVFGKK